MFVDAMDIVSLTAWRLTCIANYHQACASLRRYLMMLLRIFVPCPQFLAHVITDSHAVFGGELALAFILRDAAYLPTHLEIYVGHSEFEAVCDDPSIRATIEDHMYTNNAVFDALHQLVSCTLTIRTSLGKTIYVHRSFTTSASAPVTRASCTVLSNFVTAYSFGCSHPRLTLNRLVLLADMDFPYLPAVQHIIHDSLLAHEFSLAVSPSAWPDYCHCPQYRPPIESSGSLTESSGTVLDEFGWKGAAGIVQECWQHQFICPSQGRFFGDRGSMVDFFDPIGGDEIRCEANNVAPFGPMVVWRLVSSFECDEGCDFDDILQEGVTTIPVFVKKDPYGDLRDVVSDRYVGDVGSMRTVSL